MDVATIEYLFGVKQEEKKEKLQDEAKKKVIINLLESKRANHVGRLVSLSISNYQGIALSKMKRSPAELKSAIIELNDNMLSLDDLNSLRSLLPTNEELTKLREFTGDRSQLDRPERFFLEIEPIPNLMSRVDNWIFARLFEEQVQEMSPQIAIVTSALQECILSMKFIKILQVNQCCVL